MAEKKTVKKAAKKAPVKKAETKAEAPKQEETKWVIFRSRQPEPIEFMVHNVRARRCDQPGYCEWWVKAGEEAEKFAKHPHVMRGRIVRVED